MLLTYQELVAACLADRLSDAKIGVVVQGIIELSAADLTKITEYLKTQSGSKLYIAAVGYEAIQVNDNVEIAYTVEKAVEWRNTTDKAGHIVVFLAGEAAKMHSLADLDRLTIRDLVIRLLEDAKNELGDPDPLRRFWEALREEADIMPLDMLLDFVAVVDPQVTEPNNNLGAISENLWRLGLLRDDEILQSDRNPVERLRRNRSVLLEMEQLSDISRRRMKTALTKTKGQRRDHLRRAYRELMAFYSRSDNAVLQLLDIETVERLIKSSKPKQKADEVEENTEKSEQPKEDTTQRPLQGKELEREVANLVVRGGEDAEEELYELGEEIRKRIQSPQEFADAPTLGGRTVQLAKSADKLLELVQHACKDGNWGGVYRTSEKDLRSAVRSWDVKNFEPNRPEDKTPDPKESGLFEVLLRMDQQYLGGQVFKTSVEQLLILRPKLAGYLDLLLTHPFVLFGGYSEARQLTESYLQVFAELLHLFRHHENKLHNADPMATRFAAAQFLKLDVIYVKTSDEWKAILTPFHPLHLWRFHEILKAVYDGNARQLTDLEKDTLSKALPDIPHLLHFVIVPSDLADDTILPQSGNLGLLPTYENRTNRYLGADGLDFLHNLLRQWRDYAPYSKNQVRVALIDVPDLGYALRTLSSYINETDKLQLVVSIYATRQQNLRVELARLDYDDYDYEIAEALRNGGLQLLIHEFDDIQAVVEHIAKNPVHIAYAFDQAQPKMERAQRAQHLIVSPLVITYEYEYSEAFGRGTITPSSAAEEGLFGDYYFIVERAGQLPPNTELRLKYGEDVNIKPFNQLLELGVVRWLAIADRILTAYYAPKAGIPLGERRTGQREVAVWAQSSSRAFRRFLDLLRRYPLRYDEQVVIDLVKRFGHISSEGILGLPSVNSNPKMRESQEKGLLGTLIAAKWYTQQYGEDNSLVASLDSNLARHWLQGRLDTSERADLIGIRITPEGNIIIEPIEVKTWATLGEAAYYDREDRSLKGHAVDQLKATIDVLRPVFGGVDGQPLFTPARRETLKYQLYRECFREVHDNTWRRSWYQWLKEAFGSARDKVGFHGIVLHVQLEELSDTRITEDKHSPITLVAIGAKKIQELLSSPQSPDSIGRIGFNPPPITPDDEPSPNNRSSIDHQTSTPINTPQTASTSSILSLQPMRESEPELLPQELEEVTRLAKLFLRSCESYRIEVGDCNPKRARMGPNVYRLYVRLASGQPLKPLQNHLEDIGREMRRTGLLLSMLPNSDEIALDIPRLDRQMIYFEDALPYLPLAQSPEQMLIAIGITPEGEHVVRDLGKMPHLLVGGTTGAGKTMFLYSIIASLLTTHPDPNQLRLFLSSSGLEDFVFFEGLPHLEGGHVITDANQALELLQTQIIEEFERRERVLTSARCRNITEYNERSQTPLPPLVIIIDEFADLSDQLSDDKRAKNAFHDNIRRIAQLGRKRGVHLILCTQRPSADLVPTSIRSLLNARVSLRVNDSTASKMILDEVGAEQLQSAGDLLFKEENRVLRAQSYFINIEGLGPLLRDIGL